jgi:hypothetical protein
MPSSNETTSEWSAVKESVVAGMCLLPSKYGSNRGVDQFDLIGAFRCGVNQVALPNGL